MKTRMLAAAGLLAASVAVAGTVVVEKGSIPAGYRGFSIPLSGDQVVFVKKGDRLDVMVTFDTDLKGVKEKVTATLLQDVVVIGVRSGKLDEKGAIEVLLNPNEAQFAALALMQGQVHVSIRAEGDKEMHPIEMASFRKLFR